MITTTEMQDRTVGELAVELPDSIRVFEAWKIDYCCGGQTPVTVACERAGHTVDELVAQLARMETVSDAAVNWPALSLTASAQNIVAMFHVYTREELATLLTLSAKVLSVHGDRRPELERVDGLIRELTEDMIPHMLKEEQVLFPYVEQLEETEAGQRDAPTPFFGTVKNPVRMMMAEHDRVGELLASLREVSEGFTPPDSACFSYRELYRRLAEFEQRTHEHVHLENNLYFPRAVALEEKVGSAAPVAFAGGACGAGCSH
jgi:regulator of cell morphogenesis and NO signaling